MPRTGLKRAEVKAKILAQAEARIRKHGAEKLRLVDVAADLGISHAALYQHFAHKAALTETVTDKWLREVDAELGGILTRREPARNLIIAWFLALHGLKKRKLMEDPELFKAFDSAADENRQCIQSHLGTARKQLSELVARAMKEGSIKRGPVQRTVSILFLSTIAFHYPKLVALNLETDQRRDLKSVLSAVLDGLRP